MDIQKNPINFKFVPLVSFTGNTVQKPKAPPIIKQAPEPAIRPARTRSVNVRSPEQDELVAIMDDLDITRQEFATMCGIGLSRLNSYITGSTITVNPKVMSAARRIYKEHAKVARKLREKYGIPMIELITRWKNTLNCATDKELAQLIGVTSMTIYRWSKTEIRPELSAIARYDKIVSELAKKLPA